MPDPAREIAARLASDMETWGTIELRTHTTLLDFSQDPKGVPGVAHDQRYIETGAGQRLLELSAPREDGRITTYTDYADGVRFANVIYEEVEGGQKQTQVQIKNAFDEEAKIGGSSHPVPLVFFYLHKDPLYKSLAKATHLGSDRHLDRDCERFLFTGVKRTYNKIDMIFCIDRATAVPLEVATYRDASDRAADEPQTHWRATSLDEVEGHPFPMHSVETAFGFPEGGRKSVKEFEWEITVTDLHYNRDYPKSLFWPVYDPGVMVWDRTKNKHYDTPEDKSDAKPAIPAVGEVAPIRAAQPGDWTDAASLVGIGLGLAILATSLVMWLRRA